MDCREFEENAAGYAEGLLNGKLQLAMDLHRAECSQCDEVAQVHECLLAALDETPQVMAPESLNAKILAAVAEEEALLARENSSFHKTIYSLIGAAAVLVGAVAPLIQRALNGVSGAYSSAAQTAGQLKISGLQELSAGQSLLQQWKSETAATVSQSVDRWDLASLSQWVSGNQILSQWMHWLQAGFSFLSRQIQVPFLNFEMPLYNLALLGFGAMVALYSLYYVSQPLAGSPVRTGGRKG